MKRLSPLVFVGILVMWVVSVSAQGVDKVEQLRKQLQEMKAAFEAAQKQQREQIETLQRQLDTLQRARSNPIEGSTAEASAPPAVRSPEPQRGWSPADPIRIGNSSAYVDLGMVATFAVGGSTANDIAGGTQLGGHDPNQRGFTVQGAELNLQGGVDPYFRGNANIAYLLGDSGETGVELEEAWLETVALPGNLQIRAGQYLTDFGRINTQHPHSWGFVDAPIVSGRLLGEDGLRNPGVRLSWLAPTPFYSELFFGMQNSQGGTAYSFRDNHDNEAFLGRLNDERGVKAFSDMLFSTRYAASFDLSETQTLLGGLSALFGPNSSGGDTDTQVYGTDVYWKWKSPRAHGGFPFVSWQTEAMFRRYVAGASTSVDLNADSIPDFVPRETISDWGMYTQILWGFRPGWVAGLRGDFVTGQQAAYERLYGADLSRAQRWRFSPNLTWYPSEFSKIRLQYNYDDREAIGVDHSVWLQFEFLLGAHAAHKF
ncbi:MAG: hypothetical protein RLY20_750 [Verrucomicrobiota bacterium]|jgi:type II secretory pathway pseudopilin PulG